MALDGKAKPAETLSDITDPLSQAWCFSALQILQPASMPDALSSRSSMDNTISLESEDPKLSTPSWKLDDVKSWIRMQQAIHPSVDYNSCFQKKWLSRKISPWKPTSIRNWMKESKQKQKDEGRLQRAEVHAAISVAGLAAALAAIAAENTQTTTTSSRENAIASAASLVASQCAQIAQAVGAKREQITSSINAAMASTDANAILTLTAAASTSLRGAATLRGRPGIKEKVRRKAPLDDDDFSGDLTNCRALLANGAELVVVKPDGVCRTRLVYVVLNKEAKVILKMKKIHAVAAFGRVKQCIIHELVENKVKDSMESETPNSIVMITCRGNMKLKNMDPECHRIWTSTINHLLMLSKSITKYES